MNIEEERRFSMHLCRALEDIGITNQIIARRRQMARTFETVLTLNDSIHGKETYWFNFGSQSEGTTTLGMSSDLDTVHCELFVNIMTTEADWDTDKVNATIVKTDKSPPQYCSLQRYSLDVCEPDTELTEYDAFDSEGRVCLKNDIAEKFFKIPKPRIGINGRNDLHQQRGPHIHVDIRIIRAGPSRSSSNDVDHVFAFHCRDPPEECKFLFNRPRPGHWPSASVLDDARGVGTFVIPQGHPESDQALIEWRLSTSVIERMLMYSLSKLQLKAFVVLKLVRKTFFKPLVGDRLSTFHLKTCLMYTIEAYPSTIWREDNIIQCIKYCLITLRRWMCLKLCPNFTTKGVNLFVGKLKNSEFPRLIKEIDKLLDTGLRPLYCIDMDELGERLVGLNSLQVSAGVISRYQTHCQTTAYLLYVFGLGYLEVQATLQYINNLPADRALTFLLYALVNLKLALYQSNDEECDKAVVSDILSTVSTTLITIIISSGLFYGTELIDQVPNAYVDFSFDKQISLKLKFASLCICSNRHELALQMLAQVDQQFQSTHILQSCSGHGRRRRFPSEGFLRMVLENRSHNLYRDYVATCVIFTRHEKHCVPHHLWPEANRLANADDQRIGRDWMQLIVVDAVPFLYYLRCFTLHRLNLQDLAVDSRDMIKCYLVHNTQGPCGHIDTTLNMLGHCYEMEGDRHRALLCYQNSLQQYPDCNAASHHLARLAQQQ